MAHSAAGHLRQCYACWLATLPHIYNLVNNKISMSVAWASTRNEGHYLPTHGRGWYCHPHNHEENR